MVADLSSLEEIDLSLSGFGDDELGKLLKKLDQRERRDRVETSTLMPRWKPHRRHTARNVAISGRWAVTGSCAGTRPILRPSPDC